MHCKLNNMALPFFVDVTWQVGIGPIIVILKCVRLFVFRRNAVLFETSHYFSGGHWASIDDVHVTCTRLVIIEIALMCYDIIDHEQIPWQVQAVAYPGGFSGCPEIPPAMIFFKTTLMTHLLALTFTNHLNLWLGNPPPPPETNSGYATVKNVGTGTN